MLFRSARKLFQSMEEKGVKANGVIYDMMIFGYGREGNSYKAMKLITEMRKNGLVPNIASYGLTIRSLCNDGKCPEAEALIKDMVQAGLQPNESLSQALLHAKARQGSSTSNFFT